MNCTNLFEITSQIIDGINIVIKEELGVADEVIKITNEIYDEITSHIKNIKSTVVENGCGLKEGDFVKEVCEKKLTVFFKQYNFKDKTFHDNYVKKHGNSVFDSVSSQQYKKGRLLYNMISINFITISGHLNVNEIKQDIQHEIEHIFQQSKMNQSFGNDDLYQLVHKHIYSTNEIEWSIAIILYMSFNFEIEAFANGLYSYITANLYNGNINSLFRKSDAYEKLIQVNQAIQIIKNNIHTNEFKKNVEIYKDFDISQNNILKIAEKTLKQMNWRFGRAYMKAQDDLYKNGGFNGMLSPYFSY